MGTLIGPTIIYSGVIGGILHPLPDEADRAVGVVWLVLVAASVYAAVRAWRLAVVCEPDRIVVRGYLWSRTVELRKVLGVSGDSWPSLRFRGKTGFGAEFILLTPLIIPHRVFPYVREHAAGCRARLEEWITEHQSRHPAAGG